MAESVATDSATIERAPAKLNVLYHVIIGVAMGIVAVFTGFLWPIAILLGIVVGSADAERRKGIEASGATKAVRVLAVTGGVLALMIFGVVIFGIIALFVAALAAFSERVAEDTSPIDRTMARILTTLVAGVTWALIFFVALKGNVSINIGG